MKKRGLSVLLLFCMLLTMVPTVAVAAEEGPAPDIPTGAIYVSQDGVADGDGQSAQSALKFDEAMANAKDGNVFVVVGTVEMENWTTPEKDITICGANENAVLKFAGYYGKENVWLSLQGDLTVENLTLAFSKQQYAQANGGASLPTFIFANGHTLHLTESSVIDTPEWKSSPNSSSSNMVKSSVYIFGGGNRENDVTGDTHLILEMQLKNEKSIVYVYGGGRCSDVSGNTNVELKGEGVHVYSVVGGGLVDEDEGAANVGKNTNITISGGAWAGDTEVSSSQPDKIAVAGGGHILSNDPSMIGTNSDIKTATTNVGGEVHMTLNGITGNLVDCIVGGCYDAGKSNAEKITGTTGPVKIDIDNCCFESQFHRIFGGGYVAWGGNNRDIQVKGNVEITVDHSTVQYLYGGGCGITAALPLVTGDVNITLTNSIGADSNGAYMHRGIFVSGQNKNQAGGDMVLGNATLTLNECKCNYIHATGDGAGTANKVEIFVNGGGSTESNAEYIYNSDTSYGIAQRHPNATVHISGNVPLTQLRGFQHVNITNGSTLQQYSSEETLLDKHDRVLNENVNMGEGAKLNLTGSGNEISGAFDMKKDSTLYIAGANYFTVGGTVTTADGVTFETDENGETTGYDRPIRDGRVFLYSKTAHDVGGTFFAFPQGTTISPQLVAEDSTALLVAKHQWKLAAKPFILKPIELTKYIAGGEHNHDDPTASNCFPDPRFVGLDEDAEIKVNGNVWNKSEHHGQYPFVINYYDKDGTLLEDDHKPGTYVAKVEPSDGIKLTNITINGCKIKTEDSLLHIRNVSDVAGIENIDQFASAIQSGEPTGAVKDATAVIPDSTNYLVNNLAGQIPNADADIRLLHDELLSAAAGEDPFMKVLQQRLEGTLEGATTSDVKVEADPNRQYAMKYLDLIDANDSNLLVCAQGAYDIYLPYPAGTDQNTEFALYRFDDLNRTYTQADSGEGALDNIKKTSIRKVEVTNEKAGIKFTVPADFASEKNYSIGAMALTWVKESSGGGVTTRYTLSHDSNGGTQYKDERYVRNTVVQLDKVPTREGYTFTGWYADKELTQAITEIKMTSNKTVYAGWEETDVPGMLNGEDHYAYVVGYEDGTVRPGGNISRAEVATIFFRLLQDQVRQENLTTENVFSDVSAGDWYNTAISTMAELGILRGRTPDTFVPNAPITRAEFAAICARFDTGENAGGATFPDLVGHWAKEEVERAVSLGWIMGYEDNTFRPDKTITRAEAVTMINRVLQRNPQSPEVLLKDMVTWPDNQDPSQWYYLAIQEATNSHDYERTTGIYETWTQLRETPDWSQYE